MNYLLLFGMLTFLPGLLASQSPFQIADTTKKWNSISIGYGGWGVLVCGGTKMNMFCGDTLIAGHNYLKAIEKEDTLVDNWEHIGFLREDTLTRKVYFSSNGVEEGLIYDFDLNIGDSVVVDNLYTNQIVNLICDNTDSVVIGGKNRKSYYLKADNYSVERWIEGIGTMHGVLLSGSIEPTPGGSVELLCLSKNDTLIYMDTLFNSCFYDTFYPQIIPDFFDTAYLNEPYEFLIELDTLNVDSLGFSVEYISGDFVFDETTGQVTGLPIETGSFLCIITVRNYDMEGIVTDMIYDEIKVVNPTHIRSNSLSYFVNVNPNPFSTTTTIEYTLNSPQTVTIKFFNQFGKLVDVIEEKQQRGLNKLVWTPDNLTDGIYYFRIVAGKLRASAKIVKMQ